MHAAVLKACRWHYIVSGANQAPTLRINEALAPLMGAVPGRAEAARAMTR